SAKKPIARLSGDQNGNDAPSDPAIFFDSVESSDRIHKLENPSFPAAVKTSVLPSGENSIPPTKDVSSGGFTVNRTTGGAPVGRRRKKEFAVSSVMASARIARHT